MQIGKRIPVPTRRAKSMAVVIVAACAVLASSSFDARAEPDPAIQACIYSVRIDARRDLDPQRYDRRDPSICETAAKRHPNNVQVKALLAYARLSTLLLDRRATNAAVADLIASAKAGDPFALYVYGRVQLGANPFTSAIIKTDIKNDLRGTEWVIFGVEGTRIVGIAGDSAFREARYLA